MDYATIPSLKQRSPGVYRSLASRFPVKELIRISSAFERTLDVEEWREVGSLRPVEASFNPKPARVISILLKCHIELVASDCCTVVFACLSGAQQEKLLQLIVPDFEGELSRAMAITQFVTTLTKLADFRSTCDVNISAALLTDETRHLHLFPMTPDVLRARLEVLGSLLASPWLTNANPTLLRFLQDALHKQLRLCSPNNLCENS